MDILAKGMTFIKSLFKKKKPYKYALIAYSYLSSKFDRLDKVKLATALQRDSTQWFGGTRNDF